MVPVYRDVIATAPTGANIYRCGPCASFDHGHCQGKGRCNCRNCRGADIIATAAERFQATNSPALLRESLGEVLALLGQRYSREYQGRVTPPEVYQCSECPAQVMNLARGRRRLTCSHSCRTRRWQRLARERAQQANGASTAA